MEDPQSVTAQSEARQDSELTSPDPTGQRKMGTPTKPGENPTITHPQPAQEVTVEAQPTNPTAREEPSTSKKVKSDSKDEEERYQLEMKRKGKVPAKKKQSSKKPRVVHTAVVIREPRQESRQPQVKSSDEGYTSDKEPAFEVDISLEDEEFHDQQLDNEHFELVHPPVERVEYLPWQVELDDDLMEAMKRFDTKNLQDAFEDNDDSNKQVTCGKVLYFPLP